MQSKIIQHEKNQENTKEKRKKSQVWPRDEQMLELTIRNFKWLL